MSWHGIGLISDSWTPLANMSQIYGPPLQTIQPSAAWTGTAGSGFVITPTDPVRITAKPAVRLLVPPNQYFTDTLDVGVIAMANDGGTLRPNFGIDNVRFLFEGNEVTVTDPGFHTIQTQRGPRTYFGWWVRLKKPAGTSGQAHLYIEATARDTIMQKRVIGPYLFSPNNVLYTHSVEVAPSLSEITGQRYQTLNAAVTWLNQQAAPNGLVTITQAGFYELTVGSTSGVPGHTQLTFDRRNLPGRLNITASVPGVVIGRANYTNDAAAIINDGRFKLRFFGPNLSLDYRRVRQVWGTTNNEGANHWLDGINLINTHPEGVHGLWRGIWREQIPAVRSWPWLTEVNATDVTGVGYNCSLVRGCDIDNAANDVFNDSLCCVNNVVHEQTQALLRQELNAFTVTYTGPEATATISRLGGADGSGTDGGIWNVTIGSTTYTYDTGRVPTNDTYLPGVPGYPPAYRGADAVGGYWFSDVVAWLNTLPNVTATLLLDENDPFEKRCASGGSLPGSLSQGFTNANIKNTTRTIVSMFDVHSDVYQQVGGTAENIIFAFNLVEYAEAQLIFLSPATGSPRGQRDVFFVANALVGDGGVLLSQLGRPETATHTASHLVIAHNTLPNQGFLVRRHTSGNLVCDTYTMFKNNVFRTMAIEGNVVIPNLTIDGVRLHTGGSAPPGSTNVNIGGNQNTLFVDFAAKDLRPAGELAQVGRPSALPYDIQGAAYPANAALGAYAKGV
jgi:hypothetical protein